MNPHDPAVRPGAHLVFAELGVEDPWELSDRHPPRDPLDIVGRLVATAAHEVDDLHGDLTRAAQSAMQSLEPISRGKAPRRGVPTGSWARPVRSSNYWPPAGRRPTSI